MMWLPRSGGPVRPRVATVIPAAGASARFHGFPKACLDLDGETAVHRVARLALEEGCSPVVVVTGPHDREIRAAMRGSPVEVVAHPRWAEGRTGSIQAGLAHVPADQDVLIWPVDHPFVDPDSLAALARAAEEDAFALWFTPVFRGDGGHPVLLRQVAADAVRALPPSEPLRSLIPRLGPQVRRVAVADRGVVANSDTPEEYRRLLVAWRRSWTDA
ncbi:MAG TPA: nucleotidyltransferase family protein [Thermoplasmata archaeon]|nr:nucleotidyltransferase family protein [Thermoplasmata archaeon]